MPVQVGAYEQPVNLELVEGGGKYYKSVTNVGSVGTVQEPYEYVMADGRYKIGNSRYAIGDEVLEKATENSETTYLGTDAKGNTKFGLDVSIGVVHYKDNYSDNNEQWKDIDLTPVNGVVTKAPYVLVVDGAKVIVTDKKTGSVTSVEITDTGTKKLAKPSLSMSKGKADKKDIDIDTDLEITWENSRVKVTRVLKSDKAPKDAKFNVSQTGNGIGLSYKAEDSNLDINKKDKQVIVALKDGVLTESIDGKDLVYPVRIDPTINIGVGASSDDAQIVNGGGIDLTGISTGMGDDTGIAKLDTVLRFSGITISSGATITTSNVSLVSKTDKSGTVVRLKIWGQQSNAAATFSTIDDYTARAKTTNSVTWDSLPSWTLNSTYFSPSINTIVQELVDDYGGLSSASVAIFILDDSSSSSASRFAWAYDGSTTKCASLYLEYSVPLPTVETHTPPTSITSTTAIVEGHVTADGGNNVTDRGICWKTSTGPTITDSHTHNGTGTGLFTGYLTSLSPSTTYYVRAFAVNVGGTAYGGEITLLTLPSAPTNVAATDGVGTSNVTVSWTASTGATGYYVFRDAVSISAGNVTSYADTGAGAPTITAGAASATDGTSTTNVTLTIAGETGNNGTSHTYKVVAYNTSGNSTDSSTDTGYRGTTTLTYQWLRSAADSDAAYGAIGGATTDPYYDVGGVVAPDGRYYKATISMTGAVSQNTTADRGFMGVAPTVSTVLASSVEETTASSGAQITNLNGAGDCTVVGVQYGLTSGSYANDNHTHGVYGVGSHTVNLSSLTQGLLYYYIGYATNAYVTGYGGEQTFLTKPEAPTGFVCSTVNSTAISLTWTKGTGAGYTYIRYKVGSAPLNIADGTESYNGTLATYVQGGLADATTYYFTAWSWTSNTTLSQYSDNSVNCNSKTGTVPVLTTTVASSVEETTATVGGNVTSASPTINIVGADYGIDPTLYGNTESTVTGGVSVPYPFSEALTSLLPGTYYYYRPWATNFVGTGYGTREGFLTKPEAPTLLTATFINTTAIQLTWVKGTGATYTVVRSNTSTYSTTPTEGSAVCNTTATSFTHSGLSNLTTYYYSAWSWTSANTSQQFSDAYVYDSETVPSGTPNVATNISTGYGNDWATVAGLVYSTYPNPTLFGFQYGTTVAYGSWSNTTALVSGGIFSATITGLTPGASYHYRAFAVNSYGIGYGSDMEFSTGGTATLYESYTYGCNTTWNTNYETFSTMGSNWTTVQGQNWVAQNFTASSSHSVNQVVIWAKRTATAAAGYVYVGIREANSGQPNTPDLGLGLYAIAYVSTSGGPIEVSLENEIQIDSGKNYAIVIRAPGADATNYVQIQYNIAGGASGQMETSTDGGVVWTGSAYDFNYTIIGKPQPVYGNIQAAQTFLVGTTPHTSQRVRLILGRVGQPGNVYVSIRNYTGGVLSTADLATVALNGNAITLDKAMYDCVLTPEKSLEANKSYAIVVTAPSGDRYNYVLWCADSGAGYAGGTALASQNAGLSWATVTADYMFEVWGNSVLSVINAKVFKNYLATGDWLITTEVLNVSPPYYDKNEDPSAFYIVSFMGLIGTTYASTPCELWNKSPVAIYLNPTQASALSWGGNYKVRLSDLSSTTYAEYALVSTDWNASSLIYLDNWARLTAKDMEAYMTTKTGTAVSYTTYVANKGYVLNQDGGAIFSQACPRLAYVRPNLFQITSNQPDITTTPAPTNVGFFSQDYHTALGSYLSGMIDDGAAAAGIGDPKVFGGIIMLALYAIVAFGTVMKGFAWAGMIAAFPVILLGMYYGLLDVTMIIIILAIMAFLFMREFFFKGM